MMRLLLPVLFVLAPAARADFYFLIPSSEATTLQLSFTDGPRINPFSTITDDVQLKTSKGPLPLQKGGTGWMNVPSSGTTSATIEHGVVVRGQRDPAFVLFYPKHQAEITGEPGPMNTTLELTAIKRGSGLAIVAKFQGKELPSAEVVVYQPNDKRGKVVKTDSLGVTTSFEAAGLYGARLYHREARTGEYQGRPYTEVRHYATLTVHFAK